MAELQPRLLSRQHVARQNEFHGFGLADGPDQALPPKFVSERPRKSIKDFNCASNSCCSMVEKCRLGDLTCGYLCQTRVWWFWNRRWTNSTEFPGVLLPSFEIFECTSWLDDKNTFHPSMVQFEAVKTGRRCLSALRATDARDGP